MRTILAEVQHGKGRSVAICGEPGIGKTRLLREISGDARLQGYLIAEASCPKGATPPLGPVAEAIRAATSELGGLWSCVPEQNRSVLSRVFGELASTDDGMEESGNRLAREDQPILFEALLSLLEILARRSPVTLCVDDLQWSDRATDAFLAYLSDRIAELPILLCVAHRPFESNAEPKVCAENLPSVELGPLDASGTEDLVASLFGMIEAPQGLSEAVYRVSGGNPFFVIESVKALVESTAVTWTEDVWECSIPAGSVPEQIDEIVADRARRCGDPEREILQYAALINRPFAFELLSLVVGGDEAVLYERVEQLVHRNFLSRGDRGHYSLFHALMARPLEALVPADRRGAHHLAVARALETLDQDLS
jgi:predicted ATPase